MSLRGPKSIGARLIAAFTVVLMTGLSVFSAFLYIELENQISAESRAVLQSEFDDIRQTSKERKQSGAAIAEELSLRSHLLRGSYRLEYLLFDGEGLMLAGTQGFAEDGVLIRRAEGAQAGLHRKEEGGSVWVTAGKIRSAGGDNFVLQLGLEDTAVRAILNVVKKTFLWMFPFCLLLAAAGGALLSRGVLAPVRRLTQAARGISLTDSSQRLPLAGTGDELDELSEAFNAVFMKLRESYQNIVRFTADASHELRLPITAIKGEAEVMLERSRDIQDYQKALGSILEEFDRLGRLTNHLLTLARTDSGKDVIEKKLLAADELLSKMADFYSPVAEERGVQIRIDVPEGIRLNADEGKMQELFSNLIDNAIKYTPSGGRVDLTARSEDGGCRIEVADTGIGIPPEHQDHIFERFWRVDKSRSREEGGGGLGLSIVEAIVRTHDGRIRVESAPGRGSQFIVFLPS